jgi:hypothetical protein
MWGIAHDVDDRPGRHRGVRVIAGLGVVGVVAGTVAFVATGPVAVGLAGAVAYSTGFAATAGGVGCTYGPYDCS